MLIEGRWVTLNCDEQSLIAIKHSYNKVRIQQCLMMFNLFDRDLNMKGAWNKVVSSVEQNCTVSLFSIVLKISRATQHLELVFCRKIQEALEKQNREKFKKREEEKRKVDEATEKAKELMRVKRKKDFLCISILAILNDFY